jgi:hypothetical protein
MMMLFFWGFVPYKVIGRCQRFGEYIISIFKAEVTMMRN